MLDTFLEFSDNSKQDQQKWILDFFYGISNLEKLQLRTLMRKEFTRFNSLLDSEWKEATILDNKNHNNWSFVWEKWLQRKLTVGSSRQNILENCERFFYEKGSMRFYGWHLETVPLESFEYCIS